MYLIDLSDFPVGVTFDYFSFSLWIQRGKEHGQLHFALNTTRREKIGVFNSSKKKAVLWDLDDTLYSRVDAARQTFPGMFREHLYIDRSAEFINEAVDFMMTKVDRNSMVGEDAFRALFEKYPPDKPYIRSDCLAYYYAHISEFAKPFPEKIAVIKKIRQLGIKTAIVTNIHKERVESQRQKIYNLGIASLFDAIVISGELGIHKPDRRIFDHAAKLLGVSNDECVFVGDDPTSDVAGALNADMDVVWIDTWDYDGRFNGNSRVYRVKSVLEYFEL